MMSIGCRLVIDCPKRVTTQLREILNEHDLQDIPFSALFVILLLYIALNALSHT